MTRSVSLSESFTIGGNDIESHVDNLLIDVRELKDKVDWIEGRQEELRQKVYDLDYILSDFDKI